MKSHGTASLGFLRVGASSKDLSGSRAKIMCILTEAVISDDAASLFSAQLYQGWGVLGNDATFATLCAAPDQWPWMGSVNVACGGRKGELVCRDWAGGRLIRVLDEDYDYSPAAWEEYCGKKNAKKWRESIKV